MAIEAGNPIGGVLLHERRLESIGNHLDLPSVKGLMNYQNMTKMGPRDLWAYAHMSEVPFMYEQLMAQNIELVNGDMYSFELPTAGSKGTKIVSVVASDPARIGYGGEPFKMTVTNKNLGAYGAHVTFDPTSPYVMELIDFQIKGEQITYDVVYKGSYTKEDYIPAHLFQAGSQLYKLAGFRSKEFGQEYDSWQAGGFSEREYLGFLTNSEIQTHYHITDQAANFFEYNSLLNPKFLMDSLDKVVEYVGIESPIQDGVRNFTDYMAKGGDPGKIGFKAIATKYDDICMQILNKENMNVVVWHPGSIVDGNSYDQQFISPGIWHQLDYSGYKRFYNIETMSKDIIFSAIREFEADKIKESPYGQEREYKIRTGRGGFQLLNQIFAAEVSNVTGQIDAYQAGQMSGTNKSGIEINLPWYKSINVPGLGKLIPEIDPSFDTNNTNDILNPKLSTGFRLTSYAMIIEDYNTSSSNIKLLRNKNRGKQIRMEVISGDRTHPFFESTPYAGVTAHQGSSLQTGYQAYFRTTPDTGLVMDPTKVLKLIPKNPYNPNGNSL